MVVENALSQDEATVAGCLLNEKKHRLKQRFDVRVKLGQGTYGKVQLAVNRETGQEVAIKTIKKSKIENDQDLVRIRREIQIMSSIQHPHIIHIYEVFENKDKIVLVMQFASGGELYDFLSQKKVLSDLEARRIFRQIAAAVYYCHKNKICHRDLKLENILLDEKGNAKIADFGLSNVFDERHMLKTYCGSPLYASPEIVKGVPYYGPEVDCWSMGVLLYTLVYGAMPFDGSNFKKLVTQISEGDYFEPKKKSKASDLIRRLLTVNPVKRATIVDICTDYWVNQGYEHSLLQVAEDMANLTPVRLDLLLALAPESPVPSGDEELPEETENIKAEVQKSVSGENVDEEEEEEEEDDEEDNQESAVNSFAFVRGSQISNFTVSTPDLQKAFESEDNDDNASADFLSSAAASKRVAEKSADNILRVSSQSKPASKKSKKSDSIVMNIPADASATQHNRGQGDGHTEQSIGDIESDESNNCTKQYEKTSMQTQSSNRRMSKELNEGVFNQYESGAIEESKSENNTTSFPDKQHRTGRAPGKIVIPKTFESPQSSCSPKSQCSKSPPVMMYDQVKNKNEKKNHSLEDRCIEDISQEITTEICNEKQPSAEKEPDVASEEKKIIAKGILKKGIARAKLAERKLSQQSSTESEVATPPISTVKSSDATPSFYKAPKPYVRDDETHVRSRAEIVLTPSDKGSNRVETEPVLVSQQDAPLWNNSSSSSYQLKQNNNNNSSNWVAVSSSLDSEMSGWREQVEESLRRLSPDGSTEKSSSPVFLPKNDDEKSLVPIARSYKKFTFTKDGACITETKKIYATPSADGSWTKVEKKTKITTCPGNAEEFERFRDLHVRNSSPLTRSDSQSSSGSNEIYDDIFDSWTGDSMMCNMMKIRDMFQKFSRDSFFQKDRRRNPFRRFHRAESNRERGKSRPETRSGYSTDRDSSDVDDDYGVGFSGSNPVMYGSQGLWQFLRPQSRLRSSRCMIDAQPDRISFTRSTSHERSGSKLSNWKQCESRGSSGYNTGSRSQSRDRTQSPREKVLRFIFESPSKEFDNSLAQKDSWCFRKGNSRRDSGVNSDGYESEQSHQGASSDKCSKSGRSISSACNSSRESMIRDFVKSWPKEVFMNPSFHKEMIQEAADNRRHKVEQWLHMNSGSDDDDFAFDFSNDSHGKKSSRKNVHDISSGYATMRPREYMKYVRSSSDKISSRGLDRFPSFGESSKSRLNIQSPVSEESTRGSYSPHSADRSSSNTPVHHINFTFSDGRATNPSASTKISFDKSSESVSPSNSGSIQVQQLSGGRSNLPVVQMRVSFNRGNVSSPPSSSSAGLWQQKDSLSNHKSLGPSDSSSNRETSPLPGIKKFSTEMVHTVGGDGRQTSEKAKRLSIGPSIECEVKTMVKNTSEKGKMQHTSPLTSIWYDTPSNNAFSESCMTSDAMITNINSKTNISPDQPSSDSGSFLKGSKGENTPDSLEDVLSELDAVSNDISNSFRCSKQNQTTVDSDSHLLKIKPVGVLWSSLESNCGRQNQNSVVSNLIDTPVPIRSLSSPSCDCISQNFCACPSGPLAGKARGNSLTEIGSIWEQRNNNRTDGPAFSNCEEGNSNFIHLDERGSGLLNKASEIDSFTQRISPLTVLRRLPMISTFKESEIPEAREISGVLPSFIDDLQSPKQVLHQALRINKSLKSCE